MSIHAQSKLVFADMYRAQTGLVWYQLSTGRIATSIPGLPGAVAAIDGNDLSNADMYEIRMSTLLWSQGEIPAPLAKELP